MKEEKIISSNGLAPVKDQLDDDGVFFITVGILILIMVIVEMIMSKFDKDDDDFGGASA